MVAKRLHRKGRSGITLANPIDVLVADDAAQCVVPDHGPPHQSCDLDLERRVDVPTLGWSHKR